MGVGSRVLPVGYSSIMPCREPRDRRPSLLKFRPCRLPVFQASSASHNVVGLGATAAGAG